MVWCARQVLKGNEILALVIGGYRYSLSLGYSISRNKARSTRIRTKEKLILSLQDKNKRTPNTVLPQFLLIWL